MARISGVDIPKQKRGVIALTYIFGIGKSRAKTILHSANVSEDKKVSDWNDDDTAKVREAVGCLLYTSPSPRDATLSRMPSSA